MRESVSRLKGDEVSLRPTAAVRLDFLASGEGEENVNPKETLSLGAFLPESYSSEARLRIDGYRKLSRIRTIGEVDEFEEELADRFGKPPSEVVALLDETRIRCLCEEAGFDQLETTNSELFCRHAKRGKNNEKTYHRVLGRIPKLSSKDPLLKLKEISSFLKLILHGNENK